MQKKTQTRLFHFLIFMHMKWHKIPSAALTSSAAIQLLRIDGKAFCLVNDQGEWYATSAKCPHAGASLAEGWCEQGQLVCPYHRHHFDLSTGKGVPGQYNAVRVYPLEWRDNELYIQLPQSLWQKCLSLLK